MSFFKELKEDIAQSVNELTETFDEEPAKDDADVSVEELDDSFSIPEDEIEEPAMMFTTPVEQPEPETPVEDLMSGLDQVIAEETVAEPEAEPDVMVDFSEVPEPEPVVEPEPEVVAPVVEETVVPEMTIEPEIPVMPEPEPVPEPEIEMPVVESVNETPVMEKELEARTMSAGNVEDLEVSTDEVTVITKGTTINGGIKSDTSLVVKGTIEGDVDCAGKLTITGRVAGNTNASEIYVNTPRLEGDLNSKGIVKIDVGTVVIGGINSTSVVVAGAVKGNIEVNGPVIIDSTAVVKGDIKAKSIQINSGAVIDGHCSLQFADVDLDTFFE